MVGPPATHATRTLRWPERTGCFWEIAKAARTAGMGRSAGVRLRDSPERLYLRVGSTQDAEDSTTHRQALLPPWGEIRGRQSVSTAILPASFKRRNVVNKSEMNSSETARMGRSLLPSQKK